MGDVEPENFFSILKRGVLGASSIFALRLRDKSDTERAGDILKGMEGRRLTDRRTAALAA
jgi:hypothetical protein